VERALRWESRKWNPRRRARRKVLNLLSDISRGCTTTRIACSVYSLKIISLLVFA
jgi:hypothetical protein